MDAEFLRRELARFDPALPIERASTPPSTWYTAPAFHELEQRTVLARSWQPVARRDQLAAPGAYVTGCLAGQPWVVVAQRDGALRAFHNTCRHKGREVAQGAGTATQLVCGYHAWTYDLDGRLLHAPRVGGIRDFDRARVALPPAAAQAWGPWVFLCLDPDPPPLADRWPELTARLARTGWERLQFVQRQTWTLECNWKVYVDNYLDGGYHIPHMHPTLDAQIDMPSYRTEVFAEHSIQSAPPAAVRDDRLDYDPAARIGDAALYAWLFPNFMVNRYGPCLDTNLVVPLGPERCAVHYEFFFAETEGRDAARFIEDSVEQSAVTQREDLAICESVQRGLRSDSYDRGRYAPRVETGEHHFHRLLAARLRAGLSPEPA